jgi:predicted membrane protein
MRKVLIFLCYLLTTLFFGLSIHAESKSTLYRKSVILGDAKEVKSDIRFFAGELHLGTSTDELTECFYGYKDEFIRPYLQYKEVDHIGYLQVKSMRDDENQSSKKSHNKWSLQLNQKIKNNLAIELIAGEAHIDLEGANLSRFEYQMTAGESTINLRNTSVPEVQFSLLAGEAKIDLSGHWKNDCTANIKGGVGEIKVIVPFKTGVKIVVSGLLGEAHLPFFNRNGREYTNEAWGKTDHEIVVHIGGAIGQITVEMAE